MSLNVQERLSTLERKQVRYMLLQRIGLHKSGKSCSAPKGGQMVHQFIQLVGRESSDALPSVDPSLYSKPGSKRNYLARELSVL